MPTLAGNKHISIHFLLHGPRLFHLSTGKIRVRSVGNGHQSGYSRADTINKNINKRTKIFSYRGKNIKIQWKNSLKYGKIKFILIKGSCLHAASNKFTVGNKVG